MAKIVFCIALLVLTGCQKEEKKKTYRDFQAQGYNLVLGSDFLDVQFNLENDTLKAALLPTDIFYVDTMRLCTREKDELASSFFEQNIDKCKGWINIDGKNLAFPRVADDIHLYKDKQKIATMSVLKDYEPEGMFVDKQERNIVKFREAAWGVLSKKNKYRIAQDSLTTMARKNPIPLM